MVLRPIATSVILVALAACSDPSAADTARLPVPSRGPASVRAGQPPVVWVSGQVSEVRRSQVVLVERQGAKVVIRRLAEEATRFYAPDGGRWARVSPADVELIDVGTALCAETFLDRGVYLGIRVFVGAACGPRK